MPALWPNTIAVKSFLINIKKKKSINQLIEISKQNFKGHRINQISKSFMYLLNKSNKGIL